MPNELKVLEAESTADMDVAGSVNAVRLESVSINAGNSSEAASSHKQSESTSSATNCVGGGERTSLSNTSSLSTLVPGSDEEPSVPASETQTPGTENPPVADTPASGCESESDEEEAGKKDPETKLEKGWKDTAPFSTRKNTDQAVQKQCISWYELTLREKYEYRKTFLREYFSETRACLPYVKRLFLTIIRISPWRGVALLVLNAMNAFLPALSLKAQGDFLILVSRSCSLR
jgi:hypothetical protein